MTSAGRLSATRFGGLALVGGEAQALGHVAAMRFSAFFASHISRISGSSNTRRTVGQLWGPSAPGTHNPQGSPGRNGHIGVATFLLTVTKATPGTPRGQCCDRISQSETTTTARTTAIRA